MGRDPWGQESATRFGLEGERKPSLKQLPASCQLPSGAASDLPGGAESRPPGHERGGGWKVAGMQLSHEVLPHRPQGRNLFVPEVTKKELPVKATREGPSFSFIDLLPETTAAQTQALPGFHLPGPLLSRLEGKGSL